MTQLRIPLLVALALVASSPAARADEDAPVSQQTLDAIDDLDQLPGREPDRPKPAQAPSALTELTIDQLSQLHVRVASGLSESLTTAPGSIIVITALDIRQRGYRSIDEIFEDLPGFDVIRGRGTSYATVYQRGYRTPFTQRILFLVDGQVDNHLWTHEAALTRQYPLSNVERVEILYGPASAVYGPNAFAGIVNVVTRDGTGLGDGEVAQTVDMQIGSWDTRSVDASVRGRSGDWSFAASARLFTSDEPDLSGRFGFIASELYADRTIWGPVLDLETADQPIGQYLSRTDDRGFLGSVGYKNTKLGVILWSRSEGYGPYYAADRALNNAAWVKTSRQIYLSHSEPLWKDVTARSLVLARDNTVGGDWAEAVPDTTPGMEGTSFVTKTVWRAASSSMLARQVVEASRWKHLTLSGGLKYERKRLAKQYDIPGYYDAYSSAGTRDLPGPHGMGSHVGHSTDASYETPPLPTNTTASDNMALTDDVGGFVQGIYDRSRIRVTAGLRVDHNSEYGRSMNPRVAGILRVGKAGAVKLLYGEAFQEPAPIQLWGGWSGRLANSDLRPEKVRNLEAVFLYRAGRSLHQASAFYAHYNDVIKEESLNLGRRDITGLEYSARFTVPTPIDGAEDINGYANATFTMGWGERSYDHALSRWVQDTTRLGDIAPFKANVGVTVPLPRGFLAHVRGSFVSRRTVYSRNPLRDPARPDGGRTIDPYAVVSTNVAYRRGKVRVAIQALNLLDADYTHPGVESASSGDDFTRRSLGFHNSLLPQPGRSVFATVSLVND